MTKQPLYISNEVTVFIFVKACFLFYNGRCELINAEHFLFAIWNVFLSKENNAKILEIISLTDNSTLKRQNLIFSDLPTLQTHDNLL